MEFRVATDARACPGDFGARVADDRLLVPEALENVLEQLSIGSVEEFLSYLRVFPTAVASVIRWEPRQVETARGRLAQQVLGFISNEILDPPEPEERALGAFAPAVLEE